MDFFRHRSRLDTPGSIGMLLVRVVAGAAFVLHGQPKIANAFGWMPADAPVPGILQALAALSEFGGGLAWIVGLLVPLASLGTACTMGFAVYYHASQGHPFVGQGPAWELAAVYLAVAVLLLLAGPGKYAADRWVFGRR
jgi:putative oxidoreductase